MIAAISNRRVRGYSGGFSTHKKYCELTCEAISALEIMTPGTEVLLGFMVVLPIEALALPSPVLGTLRVTAAPVLPLRPLGCRGDF